MAVPASPSGVEFTRFAVSFLEGLVIDPSGTKTTPTSGQWVGKNGLPWLERALQCRLEPVTCVHPHGLGAAVVQSTWRREVLTPRHSQHSGAKYYYGVRSQRFGLGPGGHWSLGVCVCASRCSQPD